MRRIACVLVLLAGCLYGHDDPKPPCANYDQAGGGALAPAQELRNPLTGQCEAIGGTYPCDSACGPCPATGEADPDWGTCYGTCANLDEHACLTTANCHAAYYDTNGAWKYWACWDMPPSGTIHGTCTGNDAQTCSEHDDCFSAFNASTGAYESCVPEVVPPACATLTTESACTARQDCVPYYVGTNCTCNPSGCTCATETFSDCRDH